MKVKMRLLSLLMVFAMVVSLLPAAALAAEPDEGDSNPPVVDPIPTPEETGSQKEEPIVQTMSNDGLETQEATKEISGEISSDQTWNEGDTVTAATTISSGTITVNGMVEVKAKITISGTVTITGTGTLKNAVGAYSATHATSDMITVTTSGALTISGVTLDGGTGYGSVVGVDASGANAKLAQLTIQNVNYGSGSGSDMYNKTALHTVADASLSLDTVTITGCQGGGGTRSVILNSGSLSLKDVSFSGNSDTATIFSGKVALTGTLTVSNTAGSMTLGTDSTITGDFKLDSDTPLWVAASIPLTGTTTLTGINGREDKNIIKRANGFAGTPDASPSATNWAHMFVIAADAAVTVTSLTIDGNSGTVNSAADGTNAYDARAIFRIGGTTGSTGGSLTLGDGAVLQNNNGGNGGTDFARTAGAVLIPTTGKLTMENGSLVQGCAATDNAVIRIGSNDADTTNTVFAMNGGTIKDNTASSAVSISKSAFNMSGGEISNNTTTGNGGGVRVYNSGAFTMTGGEVSGNTAIKGGGVYVADGTVNINKGTISGNHGTQTSGLFGGGGITVNGGTVTIGDGTLTDSKSDVLIQDNDAYDGAGVMVGTGNSSAGTVTINKDAKISGNAGTFGSGVYVAGDSGKNAVATLDGAVVTGNTVKGGGGLAGGAVMLIKPGTLNLKGGVQITDNTNTEGTQARNLFLHLADTHATLTGNLTEGASVGVSVDGTALTHAAGTVIAVANDNTIATASVPFFYDDHAKALPIIVDDTTNTNLVFGVKKDTYVDAINGLDTNDGTEGAPYKTLAKALLEVSTGGTVHLLSDVDFAGPYNAVGGKGKRVTIQSETDIYTINVKNASNSNSLFHLQTENGVPTNLTLNNVIVDGSQHTNGKYGEFFIDAGGSLTLGENAALKGFTPRAVNVRRGGTLIMEEGSLITGCTAGQNLTYSRDNYPTAEQVTAGFGQNAGGAVYVCPGGTFDMRGGEISKNTSSATKGGGVYGEAGATFQISGNSVVKDNVGGNVYLNAGQAIDMSGHLGASANIFVYTSTKPEAGTDVKIATGADANDLTHVHSDNADYAGIILCGGPASGNDPSAEGYMPHSDTPITTGGHNSDQVAGSLFLSVDAREMVDMDVSVDGSNNITLEIHDLAPNKFYTVLDKDGVAVTIPPSVGSSAGNSWYKPNANGDLTFTGLPLENGPYQVVTSDNAGTAPNGNSETTTNTKVGGQVMALYVAKDAGSSSKGAWAAGVDDDSADVDGSGNARGTRAYPYKTISYAYGVLDMKAAQAGIITVLSSPEQTAPLTIKSTTSAIILGEGENITVTRASGLTTSHMFVVQGSITFRNITLDGTNGTQGALLYINGGKGKAVLDNAILQNNDGGAISNSNTAGAAVVVGGGSLTMLGDSQIKNCKVDNYASAVVIGNSRTSGTFVMKDNSKITGCEITSTSLNPANGYGGAVYVWKGAFSMEGSAAVTGNTNKDDNTPGGVFVESGTVTLSGNATITGNTNTPSTGVTAAANLYLPPNQKVSASGLTGGRIGVTAGYNNVPTLGHDTPVTNDVAAMKYFFSDEPMKYGVKLGSDSKVYLGVDAKMTIAAGEAAADGSTTSIVIRPADPDKDYWAVPSPSGTPIKGTYDPATGTVTIGGLSPDTAYNVVTTPKDGDPATDAAGGAVSIISPVKPVVPPKKDGDDLVYETGSNHNESKREAITTTSMDKITIKAEADYSYAVRAKNPNGSYTYYKYAATQGDSGGPNSPTTTPSWGSGSAGTELVFPNLPFDRDYEIVKVKSDKTTDFADSAKNVIPAVTPVPTLPPVVSQDDIITALQPDGNASLTIKAPTNPDKDYIVVDPDGKVVYVGNNSGGSHTVPNLLPGTEYKVLTQAKGGPIHDGDTLQADALKRATKVETPAIDKNKVTAAVDPAHAGKTQIVIEPASKDVTYVVVDPNDQGGKVAGVGSTTTQGGKVTIGNLNPGKDYIVLAIPKSVTAPSVGDAATDSDKAPGAVTIHTPALTVTAPTAGQVTTTSNSLTINPTVDGLEYNLMDKDGNLVKGWTPAPGSSGPITFTGLNSNTQYTVVVRDPNGGNPSLPVKGTDTTTKSGGSSSSGGGSSSGSGATTGKTEGGKVSLSPSNPKKDDKVTITVKPDEGYVLDSLTIKDSKGNEIKYTDNGDGTYTYTYTQPSGKVTIDATFRKVSGDPKDNGVDRLLMVDDHIAYMQGNEKGDFRPAGDITRAEVAQMFYNLLKDKNVAGNTEFTDVSADAWYATAVNALANLDIVQGVGNGIYDPNRAITRAEFAAMTTRFALRTSGTVKFSDVTENHWAYEPIGAAAYYGWINGYTDGTFKPDANITRAEAAKVVNTMLGRAADEDFVDANGGSLKDFPDLSKDYWAFYDIMEATNAHDFTRKDGVETWDK